MTGFDPTRRDVLKLTAATGGALAVCRQQASKLYCLVDAKVNLSGRAYRLHDGLMPSLK